MRRGLISRRSFNVYKNILKWVNNKMRDSYNKKRFSDSRKTWGYINELIGRNRDQKISLVSDNGNRFNDVKLPNYVNDYFVSSVQNLTSVFDEDINVEAVSNVNSVRNSFYLAPTDFTEIVNVMCNLPNKGNNMVDIKPNILREVSRYVVPVLVYLYNLCISWVFILINLRLVGSRQSLNLVVQKM